MAKRLIWTYKDDLAAKREGWLLTNDSFERFCIARLDDPPSVTDGRGQPLLNYTKSKFNSDTAAYKFVVEQCAKGIRHAKRALLHVGLPYK
jgi:hypothetical protein